MTCSKPSSHCNTGSTLFESSAAVCNEIEHCTHTYTCGEARNILCVNGVTGGEPGFATPNAQIIVQTLLSFHRPSALPGNQPRDGSSISSKDFRHGCRKNSIRTYLRSEPQSSTCLPYLPKHLQFWAVFFSSGGKGLRTNVIYAPHRDLIASALRTGSGFV